MIAVYTIVKWTTQYQVSYALDQDGNLKFEHDTTTASFFADAFFLMSHITTKKDKIERMIL